jgi:hypothetical protein
VSARRPDPLALLALALFAAAVLFLVGCAGPGTADSPFPAPSAASPVEAPAAAPAPWGLPESWVRLVVFGESDSTPAGHALTRWPDDALIGIAGPASVELRDAADQVAAVTGLRFRFDVPDDDAANVRITFGATWLGANGEILTIYGRRDGYPVITSGQINLDAGQPSALRMDVHELGHVLGLDHSDRAGIDAMAGGDVPRVFSAWELRALEVMYRHRRPGDRQ